MNTHTQKNAQILVLAVLMALTVNYSLAHDLMPPSYRSDPLSVHGHWQNVDGTQNLTLTDFSFVDDTDPSTTLAPLVPIDYIIPTPDEGYKFHLPNWIDKMPIKYMRLQLTWTGVPDPPAGIIISGVKDTAPVPGNIVYASPVNPLATGEFFQYYDIEFKPNPDYERWTVFMPDNSFLVQAVADTISTVPEPATLVTLMFGSLMFLRKRH